MSVKFSAFERPDLNDRNTFGNEVDYLRYCHIIARLESLEEGLTNTMMQMEKAFSTLAELLKHYRSK